MGAVAGLPGARRGDPAADLRAEVEAFLASCRDPVLLEPGEAPFALASGAGFSCTVRGPYVLLEAWDEHRSLARRAVAVAARGRGRLVLAVERFGGRRGELTLADRAQPASAPALQRGSRAVLMEALRRWLARQFPGWQLRELSAGLDLENTLSPGCPRALLTLGRRRCAAVAAGRDHAAQALTQALLWLDYLQRRDGVASRSLALFLPRGAESSAVLCLPWLEVDAALFVFDEDGVEERADLADAGNRVGELSPWIDPPSPAAGEAAQWAYELGLEENVEKIAAAPEEWSLRVHGLEFARCRRGELLYGIPPRRKARRLDPVRQLARELARVRCSPGPEPQHPWRLARPEAWLESILRGRLELIDPMLTPAPVYSQVAAVEGLDRGIMDLLALRRDGRLTLIEVKAAADPGLPLQALEYWVRIARHAAGGEFSRRGYFRGLAVSSEPPRLVLAAPALEFHPSTEAILGFFRPGVEVERAGLGVEWQQNPRVVLRVHGAARPDRIGTG